MEQTAIRVDAELIPCDSEDEDCAVFRAEVGKEFKPMLTELHDNDMWACTDFVLTTPPELHAPGVVAAMKQLEAQRHV
jgi:hypothetical protein